MPRADSKAVRRHKREEGQALVEFALILPLFLLIVVGIIQFGVALNFWLDMQRIANQGARWAVVNKFPGMTGPCVADPNVVCSGPNFQEYLKSQRISGGNDPCVVVTFPAGTNNVGDPVKVELAAAFRFFAIVNLIGIKLSADATMRLEQKPGRIATPPGPDLGGTTC